MMFEFSVVIPVKNRSELLFRALLSLRGQTYRNFEVIVVDDHSDEDVSSTTAAFSDLNIRLIRQSAGKMGACAARNVGSDLAEAEYIAYLDSDDVFLPEKMETLSKRVHTSKPNLIASSLLVYRGDKRLQLRPTRAPNADEDISEFYFIHDERIQSSSIVVQRDISVQTRWNEELRKVQDPDFFIRARRQSRSFEFIKQPLAILFDDQSDDRISTVSAEANIRAWLESPECPLTENAKAGFMLYALSHEVAKRSMLEALFLVAANARIVAPKTVLKSVYRMIVSESLFKRTAILFSGNPHETETSRAYQHIVNMTSRVTQDAEAN